MMRMQFSLPALLVLAGSTASAQGVKFCSVNAADFKRSVASLFEGTWEVKYLPGTFTVAGMTRPVPPGAPDQFEFVVTDGVLAATGGEAFGGFEFEWINEASGFGEMRYDEASELFTPADCAAQVSPTLAASGQMVTPDGTLNMDIFFGVQSLTKMPGAIIGDVNRGLFIHRPIVATRLSAVPDVPDDLLPIGDGSPGSTAPQDDDLLPVGDGSKGSTAPENDLLPVGE